MSPFVQSMILIFLILIFMAFNCPNATDQDYFQVRLPYNVVVEMIKEAME